MGKKYPDFILKDVAGGTSINVETKAASNWLSFGKGAISDYDVVGQDTGPELRGADRGRHTLAVSGDPVVIEAYLGGEESA